MEEVDMQLHEQRPRSGQATKKRGIRNTSIRRNLSLVYHNEIR